MLLLCVYEGECVCCIVNVSAVLSIIDDYSQLRSVQFPPTVHSDKASHTASVNMTEINRLLVKSIVRQK